jgi:hypothetical protein
MQTKLTFIKVSCILVFLNVIKLNNVIKNPFFNKIREKSKKKKKMDFFGIFQLDIKIEFQVKKLFCVCGKL